MKLVQHNGAEERSKQNQHSELTVIGSDVHSDRHNGSLWSACAAAGAYSFTCPLFLCLLPLSLSLYFFAHQYKLHFALQRNVPPWARAYHCYRYWLLLPPLNNSAVGEQWPPRYREEMPCCTIVKQCSGIFSAAFTFVILLVFGEFVCRCCC